MGVLVIGESLMDVVISADGEARYPGGSPMNVAVGLARLEVATSLLTRLGHDPDGSVIRGHLTGAGVELLPGSLSAARTSSAVATIASDGAASYRFDIDWSLGDTGEVPAFGWVHVGSISTFLSPGAETVERKLGSLPARSIVSYDPNIRPALLHDPVDARDRFERICRLADVVKLSDEDAAWLYPDHPDVCAYVLSLGPRVVAMTRGAGGAEIRTQRDVVSTPAGPVRVADTIGAGDSFMAALVQQLLGVDLDVLTGPELKHIGAFATRAAGVTCGRVGADPPTLRELLLLQPLRDLPDHGEAAVPFGADTVEVAGCCRELCAEYPVLQLAADADGLDESDLLQHGEVFGDGLPGDRQSPGEG